jgi:hypothetical protein
MIKTILLHLLIIIFMEVDPLNIIVWTVEVRKIMNFIKTPHMNPKIIRILMHLPHLELFMYQKNNILLIMQIRMTMNTKRECLVYRKEIRIYNLIQKKRKLINKNRNKDLLSWINFFMPWGVGENND